MRTKVQKWGNSLAIRIPKLFAQNICLRNDDSVELLLKKGKLIISPIIDEEYTLEELLSGITVDNVHSGIDMGKPVAESKPKYSYLSDEPPCLRLPVRCTQTGADTHRQAHRRFITVFTYKKFGKLKENDS